MNKNKGFTLIELLVVIAVVGILASVVLAALSTSRDKGKDKAIISDLLNARTEIQLYFSTNGTVSNTPVATLCPGAAVTPVTSAFNDSKVVTILTHVNSFTNTAGTTLPSVYCSGQGSDWAVSALLKTSNTKAWCVDSTGKSKTYPVAANTAFDAVSGYACK